MYRAIKQLVRQVRMMRYQENDAGCMDEWDA
jgi:hypothetical protein